MYTRGSAERRSFISRLIASTTLITLLTACGGGGGGGGGGSSSGGGPPAGGDSIPPDTTLSAPPAALSNSSSVSIGFTSSEANSTFESRLDAAAFAAATSPQNLTGLADGSHTFHVRARDAAGNIDATPASVTWMVDTAPPDTVKLTGPAALVNVAVATFTFNSADSTATFEASLDNGAYATVTSPHSTAALADGTHRLQIRARDAAGNVDPTPVDTSWTVDATAPDTSISSAPSGVITTNSATVNATSPDATAGFEVSLDGGTYTARSMPLTVTGLVDGPHEWRVRARDPAGNVDATPAIAQFMVDTKSPDTSFSSTPPAITNSTSASFTLSSDDVSATFETSIDGGAYAASAASFQLTGLAVGTHTLSARARDPQNHVDPTPATFNWRIDTTPPTARMQFPLPVSYTSAGTLTVRGTAQDAYGVASVKVNGVSATTATGFNSWTAVVPIQAGENQLEVTARDVAGNETTNPSEATVFNRGPPIVMNRGMDYDPTGDRIIVSDSATRSVYGYRVSDGFGQLISDRWPPFTAPHDGIAEELVVDAANNRALLVDWGLDMLVGVDLTTGLRSSVSAGSVVSAPTQFGLGFGVALDASGQRAFVTARQSKAVIGVNLTTGLRTVISSPTVGTGAALGNPLGIAYDNVSSPGTPRLLVADATFGAGVIVSIDILTGNRLPFSSAAPIGQGVTLGSPLSMKLDAANSRLLVQDDQLHAILAVDLATGNRSVVSATGTGSGPAMNFSQAIGLALKPSTGLLVTSQRGGELLAVNTANGNRTPFADANVGSGTRIYNSGGLIVEQASGKPTSLLLMEADAQRITRIDLATGNRTVVSGDPGNGSAVVGSGPALDRGIDLVLDVRPSAGGNSVLALVTAPGNKVLSVDLATGNRTLVADLTTGSPAVTQLRNLALDVTGNRVLVTNNDNSGSTKAVYAVDLASGARTSVSGNGVGAGNAFGLPTSIVLDSTTAPTRAFVSDGGAANAIVAVDLATGNRSVAIPGGSGIGSPFTLAGPLVYDAANARLLIGNLGEFQKIIAAPLPFTSRSLVSGSEIDFTVRGTGPLQHYAPAMTANLADGVLFLVSYDSLAVYAIDTYSGDRVYISR
jgi:hypothetical protein